jgi:hypothetical protein
VLTLAVMDGFKLDALAGAYTLTEEYKKKVRKTVHYVGPYTSSSLASDNLGSYGGSSHTSSPGVIPATVVGGLPGSGGHEVETTKVNAMGTPTYTKTVARDGATVAQGSGNLYYIKYFQTVTETWNYPTEGSQTTVTAWHEWPTAANACPGAP